jgi:hypothetical protein
MMQEATLTQELTFVMAHQKDIEYQRDALKRDVAWGMSDA